MLRKRARCIRACGPHDSAGIVSALHFPFLSGDCDQLLHNENCATRTCAQEEKRKPGGKSPARKVWDQDHVLFVVRESSWTFGRTWSAFTKLVDTPKGVISRLHRHEKGATTVSYLAIVVVVVTDSHPVPIVKHGWPHGFDADKRSCCSWHRCGLKIEVDCDAMQPCSLEYGQLHLHQAVKQLPWISTSWPLCTCSWSSFTRPLVCYFPLTVEFAPLWLLPSRPHGCQIYLSRMLRAAKSFVFKHLI